MFVGPGLPSCQTGIVHFVFQKVELRKAVVAWKRTAQVAKEQTEEEQETQVTGHHSVWLSLCALKLLPRNPLCHWSHSSDIFPYSLHVLVGPVSQVPGYPQQIDSSEVSETGWTGKGAHEHIRHYPGEDEWLHWETVQPGIYTTTYAHTYSYVPVPPYSASCKVHPCICVHR